MSITNRMVKRASYIMTKRHLQQSLMARDSYFFKALRIMLFEHKLPDRLKRFKNIQCVDWRLPWSPLVHKRYIPSQDTIELELTEACTLACTNCETSCGFAKSDKMMTATQIEKFIDQSITSDWAWRHIKLRGGEPTLNPELFDIIDILEIYRGINSKCLFYLLTNGYSDETKIVLDRLPNWIIIENTHKKSSYQPHHDSFNLAPVDLTIFKNADFTKGCWRSTHCGISLSRNGFYCCGAAPHIDRVFGFNLGIKELKDVNLYSLRKLFSAFCKYCGHFKEPNDFAKKSIISPTWETAYKKYRENAPNLDLY